MKKLALLLALLLLLSACGRIDDTAKVPEVNDTVQEAPPSPSAQAETPPPSSNPTASSEPALPLWKTADIIAPAVPMDGESAPEGMEPLKELPIDYSGKQAELDGCYGDTYDEDQRWYNFGEEILSAFEDNVEKGIPCSVRQFRDAIPSEYKTRYATVTDIEYDGENTVYREFIRDVEMGLEYEKVSVHRDTAGEFAAFETNYDHDRVKAKKDGCIIIDSRYGKLLYNGAELWNEFYDKVCSGEKASVRIYRGYEEADYVSLEQLEFDGEFFIYTTNKYDDDTQVISTVYPYLNVYEVPDWSTAQKKTLFVLCYSDKYTYDYIVNCRTLYNEPFIEGGFHPPNIELTGFVRSEPLTFDDFVLPEGMGREDAPGLTNEPHIYEVLPGTDEWKALDIKGRKEATRVTEEEVKGMTAEALIETILTYPYLGDIGAYNTFLMGMEGVAYSNPAIDELFSRDNAYYALVKYGFDRLDETRPVRQLSSSILIVFYEQYVMTGIYKVPNK